MKISRAIDIQKSRADLKLSESHFIRSIFAITYEDRFCVAISVEETKIREAKFLSGDIVTEDHSFPISRNQLNVKFSCFREFALLLHAIFLPSLLLSLCNFGMTRVSFV